MKSARNVVVFPKVWSRRASDEMAFLPAALEIVETPPSPIGRAIGVVIMTAFCLALVWACIGKIDMIASAQGKIIPSGRTKVIQPFELGVVRAIHVRDGESVRAGQVLVELDPTISEAERNHLRSDLAAAELTVARLQAALSGSSDPLAVFHPSPGAPVGLVATERQLLADQTQELDAKLSSLDRQRAQKDAELATIRATIAKIEATTPLIQKRLDIRQVLMEKGLASKLVYFETMQQLVDQQQERGVLESRLHEAEAALAAITETRLQAEAEYRRTQSNELAEAERKVAGLTEDLVKAEQRTRFQTLTAPVDGVVQQLAIHTLGGVVTPAQALMVVVPADSHLEIEAMVRNRDIGFVHPGQKAHIKVDTFSFTRYGLLGGEVLSVSPDAISRDKPQDQSGDKALGSEASNSEPRGQELMYLARISLDRAQMQIDDRLVSLSPGMAVTAEIATGSRTIISYLLSPLLRYRQDSLHER